MTDDHAALLAELEDQEDALAFTSFDNLTAWRLGTLVAERALAERLPVAVAVRRNGQRLFHVGLPGSSADNDVWLDRKMAVVDLYGRSSYLVGTRFRASGGHFDTGSRLDTARYAAHGGAFPVLVRGVGCVGSVAVSGLPEAEDHRVVVEGITAFLAADAR
ncbi:heme-degrading domain-containing protein [Kineococcus indalonis]|uniref:heme-degrading domain-containing protein n=1 Tax=Kineococcus indalonis TaxID=2696566 RepID=UPI001412C1CF|nr:heme-degrading domain-containing protein [Kineococcus indalonis]NAZ88466.1 heme-degrading domain-containing protein [Kineococcus indalonis]